MFRAVIFDMDDTLIKTREAKYQAHKHTGKKFYNIDDLQASRGAGIEFLAIANHTTPAKDFAEAGANYLTDFSELADYFS